MEIAIGILIAWAVVVLAVLALLASAGRADRRTAAQLREAGVGVPRQQGATQAAVLRDAVALEREPIAVGGYGGLLLNRLAVQTCRMIGVDAAAIFVHDPRRNELTLVAAHRLDPDLIGRRVASAGLVRDAALEGARSFVPQFELLSIQHLLPAGADAMVAGLAGGAARGVLVAAGSGPFSERDLTLLGHISELAATGLGDAQLRRGLDAALEGGVRALEAAIERANLRAAATSRDVVALSTTLARLLGLDAPAMVELQLAARLRDVGELAPGVDQRLAIIDEPLLNPAEASAHAADVLARVPGLEVVALILRHEHERWDGRGLPDRLEGERIPLASRILAVAAAFTQLTGPGGSTDFDALAVIALAGGSRFDPVVVETLATLALPPAERAAPAERPDWAAADLEQMVPV